MNNEINLPSHRKYIEIKINNRQKTRRQIFLPQFMNFVPLNDKSRVFDPLHDYIYLELFYSEYKLAHVSLIYSFVRLSVRHEKDDNKMFPNLTL